MAGPSAVLTVKKESHLALLFRVDYRDAAWTDKYEQKIGEFRVSDLRGFRGCFRVGFDLDSVCRFDLRINDSL